LRLRKDYETQNKPTLLDSGWFQCLGYTVVSHDEKFSDHDFLV
jgi:hypothetical protein